jgi:hypothetical protein
MIDPITMARAREAGLPAAESHPGPPVVCFPLRTDWEVTQPAEVRASWPEPAIPMRILEPWEIHDLKAAPRALITEARQYGWSVQVTESVGSWPSVGQKPSAQKASIAVRLWRANQRAVAVYVEGKPWKWDTMRYWRLGAFPEPFETITQLKAAIMMWLP